MRTRSLWSMVLAVLLVFGGMVAPPSAHAEPQTTSVTFTPDPAKDPSAYDMWAWSASSPGGMAVPFTGTDADGQLSGEVTFEDPTFKLIVRYNEGGNPWAWQTSDLEGIPNPSSIGVTYADPTTFEVLDATLTDVTVTVHYVRFDNAYEGWNIWTWLPGSDGRQVDLTGTDADGYPTATIEMNDPDGISSVGIILRKTVDGNEWGQKNNGSDLFVTEFDANGHADVWVVQGNDQIFTDPTNLPDAPDTQCLDVHTDEFNAQYYFDGDLGALYSPEQTTFRLWAPTAEHVDLVTFAGDAETVIPMTAGEAGTWEYTASGDQNLLEYVYRLDFTDGTENESVDPYARAVTANGVRSVVVDAGALTPENWDGERMDLGISSIQDTIIYEAHVRDLTIGPDNGIENKGKFLGLTETGTTTDAGNPSGLDYISSLGVTHVQILPMYDFGSVDELGDLSYGAQYNWGYDPMNYNVPEGSYSSDPTDPTSRIIEAKAMINSIHDAGMGVIMDVVYNHVYNASTSPLAKTVPGYYFRYDENCNLLNGTGVGNETASEQPMMRNYIIDSVTYWAENYNIDGFRFDLMGIHDVETMNAVREALDEIDPNIVILGEGWTMGSAPVKADQTNAQLLPGIAFFNDNYRDALKGDNFELTHAGFVTGANNEQNAWDIWNNIKGAQYVRDYIAPYQSVVYNEAHDNYTMYDKIVGVLPHASDAEVVRRHTLATSTQYLANGTLFLHAGQEFLRTKDGDHNSYMSPDSVNEFDYDRAATYADAVQYVKDLNEFRKTNDWVSMDTHAQINAFYNQGVVETNHISYTVTDGDIDKFVFINGSTEPWVSPLEAGTYNALIADMKVNDAPVSATSTGTIEVAPLSITVLEGMPQALPIEVVGEWINEYGTPVDPAELPEFVSLYISSPDQPQAVTATLQKAGNWTTESNPVPLLDAEGNPITYTVDEFTYDGYTVTASDIEMVDGKLRTTVTFTKEAVVDTTDLEAAIADGKATNTEGKTDESVANLTEAIDAGEAVLANPEATQDEVDAAAAAIRDTIAGLEDEVVEPEPTYPASNPNGWFYLLDTWGQSFADYQFSFGLRTDNVAIGDWDGNGTDTIALRRGNVFHVKNSIGEGNSDLSFTYGQPGDEIFVGDWDGDGVDTLAVRRGKTFYVKNSVDGGWADIQFDYGRIGDEVLVGDWNGDGTDTFAVRRGNTFYVKNSMEGGRADAQFDFGRAADTVLVGDWNGNQFDSFAVRRGNAYYLNNELVGGRAEATYVFGRATDEAWVGDWNGDGIDTLLLRR